MMVFKSKECLNQSFLKAVRCTRKKRRNFCEEAFQFLDSLINGYPFFPIISILRTVHFYSLFFFDMAMFRLTYPTSQPDLACDEIFRCNETVRANNYKIHYFNHSKSKMRCGQTLLVREKLFVGQEFSSIGVKISMRYNKNMNSEQKRSF